MKNGSQVLFFLTTSYKAGRGVIFSKSWRNDVELQGSPAGKSKNRQVLSFHDAELQGCSSAGCSKRTNLENKSLISADRSNKATLLLTILRFVFKSSAKDLSPPIFHISISGTHKSLLPGPTESHCIILDTHEVRLFVID